MIGETESAKFAIEWLKGQPFTNVLLAAIFAVGCYASYFAANTAIPAHLHTIQEGYERIEESHRAERSMRLDMYDKWMEKIYDLKSSEANIEPPHSHVSTYHAQQLPQ